MAAATVLTLIAALLFAAFAVLDRYWSLALFCALLPVYLIRLAVPIPLGPLDALPTTLLEIFFWTLFLSWLLLGHDDAKASDAPRRGLTRWAPGLTLLVVGATIGVLVAPDAVRAFGTWRAYFLEPLLFFLMFVDIVRRPSIRRLVLGALGLSLIAVGLAAVFQKMTGVGIPNPVWRDEATRRVTAFFGFPNGIGLFAAPVTVLMTGWFAGAIRHLKLREHVHPLVPTLAGGATVLGGLAILFAVSEGAALGVAAGLLLFGLLWRPLRKLALVAVILACLVTMFVPPVLHYASVMYGMRDDSWAVRKIVWHESLAMLDDRPVFGAGLSGYQRALLPYHEAQHIEIFMFPHNVLLNFWSETGLIGLAGFLVLVWTFFATAGLTLRERPDEWLPAALMAAMAALLVHGLVDVPYFKNDLAFLFFVLLGLAESVRRSHDDDVRKPVDRKAGA